MTERIKEQIFHIRNEGAVNLCDVKAVFELAIKKNFHELANYIFEQTREYLAFIIYGTEV